MNTTTGAWYDSLSFGGTADQATNSISLDDEYIYLANSNDGLSIIERGDISVVAGQISYSGSTNHAETNGKIIVVANGIDGVKFLVYK